MLHDIFLASIFLAYVEQYFFFAFARENSLVQPLEVCPEKLLIPAGELATARRLRSFNCMGE